MTYNEFRKQALSNSEVKAEFEELMPKYALIRAVLDARIEKEMTQQELADKAGVNRADISKLENGKSNPSYNMLCRIAKGLGMKVKMRQSQRLCKPPNWCK